MCYAFAAGSEPARERSIAILSHAEPDGCGAAPSRGVQRRRASDLHERARLRLDRSNARAYTQPYPNPYDYS